MGLFEIQTIESFMEERAVNFCINVIFNQGEALEGFIPSYGFSVLIYNSSSGNYLLFDTGSDGNILIHNLKESGISATDINKVVISHNHQEHVGGLDILYQRNPDIEIYVPVENHVLFNRKYPMAAVYGIDSYSEIDDNIFVTGQLGNYLKEQALLLKTEDKKGILLVGCCHPGLKDMFSACHFNGDIKAIFGGLHNTRIFSDFNSLDFIGACHCTTYLDLLEVKFPDKYHEIRVGEKFVF
jgi:7,8-dihydropterin-6-yl-methyl-4-(beta-D-ribofuranosyl)aminobenzene 5'-phosphate synthase